jgi:hypothetical protein
LDLRKKGYKNIDINREEVFQKNRRLHHYWNEEILGDLEEESVEKLRRYKSNWL